MGKGWIRFYRKSFDNPYLRKPNYFWVWMYLCSEANHDEDFNKKYLFKGEQIVLKRGQCIVSQKQISKESNISLSSIHKIFKTLKREMMCEIKSDNKCTLITINNYDFYQEGETKCETNVKPNGNQSETHKNLRIKELNKKDIKRLVNFPETFDTELKKQTPSKLKKPTAEAVQEYCDERENGIVGQHFVDKMDSIGWVVGKNKTPVKDWKAVIRTWENNIGGIKKPKKDECKYCNGTGELEFIINNSVMTMKCHHNKEQIEKLQKQGAIFEYSTV